MICTSTATTCNLYTTRSDESKNMTRADFLEEHVDPDFLIRGRTHNPRHFYYLREHTTAVIRKKKPIFIPARIGIHARYAKKRLTGPSTVTR